MVGTAGAAVGTNLINNVPMAVVLTSALHGVQYTSASTRLGFIAATIFGCYLGPKLTTVGSLATALNCGTEGDVPYIIRQVVNGYKKPPRFTLTHPSLHRTHMSSPN